MAEENSETEETATAESATVKSTIGRLRRTGSGRVDVLRCGRDRAGTGAAPGGSSEAASSEDPRRRGCLQ